MKLEKILFIVAIMGIILCSAMAFKAGYIYGKLTEQREWMREYNIHPIH